MTNTRQLQTSDEASNRSARLATEAAPLLAAIQSSPQLLQILSEVAALELLDCFVAAGVLRNTFWSECHGRNVEPTLQTDVDVVHFDSSVPLSRDSELERRLTARMRDVDWDVTNQAHVHRWYQSGTGQCIEPLTSTVAGIGSWPETATCIGVRMLSNQRFEFLAPHGFDDLLGMHWRRNPQCPDADAFTKRTADKRIREIWPLVQVHD